jgi:AAA domain
MKDDNNPGFHEMDKDDEASPFDVPLTVDEWKARELPPPDRLLGEWLTTTSRVYMSADTGLGKTSLGMAIAAHLGAGLDFLRWRCHRRAQVLYIGGEMSRRLFKRRIDEAVTRLGAPSPGARFLSKEDIEIFPPLNTPAGLAFLTQIIDSSGGIDLIIFDNIMAPLVGDQKDELSWNAILPLLSALTKAISANYGLTTPVTTPPGDTAAKPSSGAWIPRSTSPPSSAPIRTLALRWNFGRPGSARLRPAPISKTSPSR